MGLDAGFEDEDDDDDDGGVGAQECGDEDKRKDTEGNGHGMERLERGVDVVKPAAACVHVCAWVWGGWKWVRSMMVARADHCRAVSDAEQNALRSHSHYILLL